MDSVVTIVPAELFPVIRPGVVVRSVEHLTGLVSSFARACVTYDNLKRFVNVYKFGKEIRINNVTVVVPIICGVVVTGCYMYYNGLASRYLTKLKDYLLYYTSRGYPLHHHLKTSFRYTVLPYVNTRNKTHSHPFSAGWRSSAILFARDFASSVGIGVVSYQGSNSDLKRNIAISRSYYWHKDLQVEPASFNPKPSDLICIIDVDYYMDMADFLLSHDNPVFIYCVQPTKATDNCEDWRFRFKSDNKIEYQVSGGGTYSHHVWDYGQDVITVTGLLSTKSYVVDRRKANEHHSYILLIPLRKWNFPFAWLANYWLEANPLKYLTPVKDGYVTIENMKQGGAEFSVAKVDNWLSATLSTVKVDALRHVANTSNLKLGNATSAQWCDGDKSDAAVLTDYIRNTQPSPPPVVYSPTDGARTYNVLNRKSDIDNDLVPLLESYMSPILHEGFVPARTKNNEEAAVEGRLLKPREDAKILEAQNPSPMLLTCVEEFVDLLTVEPVWGKDCRNALHPTDLEEVYARQNRPTQRALLDAAESAESKNAASIFLKAEAYQNVNAPRLITTYDTVTKRDYSCYTYALADYIKEFDWYAFGKTPVKIAQRVADISTFSKLGTNAADASKMDGHVVEMWRKIELKILLALFDVAHHEEIIKLHGEQYNVPAVTTLGVLYKLLYERGSGSPETALFNTLLTKFIDYLSRRLAGVDKIKAFEALGIFGGDDSYATQISDTILNNGFIEKAGAMIGQRIENVEFKRGAPGVNFLSRYYTDEVWFGNSNSICDVPRILSKLHLSVKLAGVTPLEKLQQKLAGLNLSDRNTPIIKQLIYTAQDAGMKLPGYCLDGTVNVEFEFNKQLSSWWSQYGLEEDRFTTSPERKGWFNSNWPNEVSISDSWSMVESMFEFDTQALFDHLAKIDEPSLISYMLCCPLIADPKPPKLKVPFAQVDDDIKYADPESKYEDIPDLTSRDICHKFIDNKCKNEKCKFKHVKVCRNIWRGKPCSGCKFPHIQK